MSGTLTNLMTGLKVRMPGDTWTPPPIEKTRWFNVGPMTSGKTSIAASIPRCILLDFEDKGDCIRNPKATIVTIKNHADMDKVVAFLEKDKCSTFDMFAMDTIDSYEHAILRPWMTQEIKKSNSQWASKNPLADITDYAKSNSGSGGWGMLNARTIEAVYRLQNLGMGWWINSHIKDTPEGAAPRLNSGVRCPLQSEAHFKTVVGLIEEDTLVEVNGVKMKRKQTRQHLYAYTLQGLNSHKAGNIEIPFPIRGLPEGDQWDTIKNVYTQTVHGTRNIGDENE